MQNRYTNILTGNQSKQVELKINTSEAGILSTISINEWNNGEIKQKMRDHSPFIQGCIRAKAKLKNPHVDQCAIKEISTCTD